MNQLDVDKQVEEFKQFILARIGSTPWVVVLASPKSKTVQQLAEYEMYILPEIIKKGFKAPTVAELFDQKITFEFGDKPSVH